ncbi:class I adenylate-forming enzyme family protein [Actinokineospora inagensis]|uniref:class I adenylate-forming enzyme family protein n=1 Tax=Actinokineospora inagensis TaxID=103730 RepID=UPI00041D48C0|nr:fatty acid--CoA ligase family protein [Actinokineospora inagensis]
MHHPFLDRLAGFEDAEAIVFDGTTTYRELLDRVADWQDLLDRHDVAPGQVVTLEGPYSPDLCAGLLALIARDVIVVPLTVLPADKRAEFLDVCAAEVLIAADGTSRVVTRTGKVADHELYRRLRAVGAPGLVLFSSGTSGRSKASVLDFDKVIARYGEPTKPRRILSFLSLDHIGGVNTLLATLSQGGTVVTVAERTPDAVLAAVAAHDVQVLPTTPTFLNMVLISGAADRHRLDSLQLITYGTEPMPLTTLRRLKEVFPQIRFKQTYGLSELGILPTRSRGDDSLWVKLGAAGFEHKVVDNVLWIRSEMAMLGYLNAPAPFDDEGFFNTQDVVETDGEWVRILGRRSEIINVGGEKVYPSEVESVILDVPNVAEVTVSGKPSPVTGNVVVATVKLVAAEDQRLVGRRVREECARRLEAFKVPAVVTVSAAEHHSDRFKKTRKVS